MRKTLALVGLVVLGASLWVLWPDSSNSGAPSVTERARQGGGAGGLATKVISSEDLPPEGTRSLFDHLVAQNESLPFPFEKLVAMAQAQDPQARAPVALLIPLGRSLLKASAHFARPRVLAAADFQAPDTDAALGLTARGRLVLGFVEDRSEGRRGRG